MFETLLSKSVEATMNIEHMLWTRNRERSNLLKLIVECLIAERSVRAAWLSGSVSRGSDDALSDLDVHIVIDDRAMDQAIDNRKLHAADPARPILLMDNFRNAPIGGAYLLALYKGEFGPQHVDWFWQPESKSRLPDDEKILFDRAGLPKIPGAQWRREAHISPSGPEDIHGHDLLTHKMEFFWAMSLIVAKYIARRNGGIVERMTSVIARTLDEIAILNDAESEQLRIRESLPSGLGTTSSRVQFDVLRNLSQIAETLGRQDSVRGAAISSEAIRQIYRFFCFTEALSYRSWQPGVPRV